MKTKRTQQDIVAAKRMLELLQAGKDVRQRKVRRIRAAIKVRRYENAMKLAVAMEKMIPSPLVGEGRVRGGSR